MGLLDTLNDKKNEIKEQGDSVVETGQEKLEEAGEFKGALDGLDSIDEDTQEIIDTATEGAQEVASENADMIQSNMEPVNEGLTEVSDEANEAEDAERSNVDSVSDAPGDYGGVASQASSGFEQLAEGFNETSESAQEMNDEFGSKADEMASQLESIF